MSAADEVLEVISTQAPETKVKAISRKEQILQVLAEMLEQPQAEKITTALLAEKLQVSEAALYRHFASKAQMFEGLIEFIEHTLFGLINQITQKDTASANKLDLIMTLLLEFACKNPGMTRVLIGDALVHENPRLQLRINQLQDRLEATLKQILKFSLAEQNTTANDSTAQANVLICFVIGRWHQFAKSGFKRIPNEYWTQQKTLLI